MSSTEAGATTSASRMIAVAFVGALAALIPAFYFGAFTVDDAFIPARYAAHIVRGLGYRFNAGGPATDGVTPLGFPYLLAPFSGGTVLGAFEAAKAFGRVAWVASAGVLAVAIDRASNRPLRWIGLALVALSSPLAAWCNAGLETGVVAAFAAFAVASSSRPIRCALLAGLVAAWRPEALPFAILVALGAGPFVLDRRAVVRSVVAGAPFVAITLARVAIFGRPFPLSVLAKPADASLGFTYATACFLLTGPLLLVAPAAWRKLDRFPRMLIVAVFAHFVTVGLAGGDWMPLSRLVVPALPAVALAAAHVASVGPVWPVPLRAALALGGAVFQFARVGPTAAAVGAERRALLEELRPAIADAKVVAVLDVGWVGAATEATVVDLAGLTDPTIAGLAGSHTNKRLPEGLLDARGVDTLLLLLPERGALAEPWNESIFAREVEDRVARSADAAEWHLVARSDRPHLRYVVMQRPARGE